MIICQCFSVCTGRADTAIEKLVASGVHPDKITPARIFQEASGHKTFAKRCGTCVGHFAERMEKRFVIPA